MCVCILRTGRTLTLCLCHCPFDEMRPLYLINHISVEIGDTMTYVLRNTFTRWKRLTVTIATFDEIYQSMVENHYEDKWHIKYIVY